MAEQVAKIKKKQWCEIVGTKQFENVVLGETLVYEPQSMLGKHLSLSLMNLMNDVKRQNINIHFQVTEVEGSKAKAPMIGYEIVPSSVRRLVRRNSEKSDLSFACETADNVALRVKPLVISKATIKGSVAAKLRNNVVLLLTRQIKKMTYDEVMNDIIAHKLQQSLREILNKIYPVKVCEIKYVGLETREKQEGHEEISQVAEAVETAQAEQPEQAEQAEQAEQQ